MRSIREDQLSRIVANYSPAATSSLEYRLEDVNSSCTDLRSTVSEGEGRRSSRNSGNVSDEGLSDAAALRAAANVVYYNCTLCSFVCTWKYDLKLHLRHKHGINRK